MASHDSLSVPMTAAQPAQLSIAIHYQQSQIPLSSSFAGPHRLSSAAPTLGGSGYGPPVLTDLTPVQRIVKDALENRKETSLVCLPITNDRWRERWERLCVVVDDSASADQQRLRRTSNRLSFNPTGPGPNEYEAEQWRAGGGFRRGEVNVTRAEETQYIIGLASEWLELDSDVEGIRFDSEIALKQEIAYASHLHIASIIMPPLRHMAFVVDYARALNTALSASAFIHIAVPIPVSNALLPNGSPDHASPSPWDAWNTIRHVCGYSNRLHLALNLTNPLPSLESLQRWQAESLRVIWLPASAFLPNAKGYPVLSKSHQAFLKSIVKYKPTIILSGTDKGLHTAGGIDAYAQYIRFLERKQAPETPVEAYAGPYMDFLQAPLQPLMDNLETDTYEGFEKDPIKYQQYEEAVYQAIMDRPSTSNALDIFVCGAGRGPLVAASLKAAKRAGNRRVKITAVEKNANAFVLLQERKAVEWGDLVDLVFSDMRSFRPETQADVIVSELLGSFGDNELSPECLDGVIPRLLKNDGASIPYSYTSYLAPVSSAKLHDTVTSVKETDKAEQPYVVMFNQACIISATRPSEQQDRIQSCWSFQHPRHDVVLDSEHLPLTNSHNCRSAHLNFYIPHASVCHGFGGYFEALLYGDVSISIHPERMDPNMLSWFPMFFPLREPLYLPARSELDVFMYRLNDAVKRRIWFEWCAEAFLPAPNTLMASSSTTTSPANGFFSPAQTPLTQSIAWGDAYAPAPSPQLTRPQAASVTESEANGAPQNPGRIKIGMTRMHNVSGSAFWVGL